MLKVRGASAIGDAAAIGVYLVVKNVETDTYYEFYMEFRKAKEYLDSARPTAVNLSWALKRMENVVIDHKDKTIAKIKNLLRQEAIAIKEEDINRWILLAIDNRKACKNSDLESLQAFY